MRCRRGVFPVAGIAAVPPVIVRSERDRVPPWAIDARGVAPQQSSSGPAVLVLDQRIGCSRTLEVL
jgi:hypothetical protein